MIDAVTTQAELEEAFECGEVSGAFLELPEMSGTAEITEDYDMEEYLELLQLVW